MAGHFHHVCIFYSQNKMRLPGYLGVFFDSVGKLLNKGEMYLQSTERFMRRASSASGTKDILILAAGIR